MVSGEDISREPPSDVPCETIGRYAQAVCYRNGLFSSVYRARAPVESDHDAIGRMVALKVTTPSMMVEPHDSQREARILQGLRHDHVIPLLDTFQQSGGRLVLVFPFMPYDLRSLLDKGRLQPDQAISHIRDMFAALAFLHSAGVIHRDIKPSNVLLKTPSGPAYLADFGIAWSPNDIESEMSNKKFTEVGTTCYRPPELLFGHKSYGCSLDLWAAGCVVAETASLSCDTLFRSGDLGSELALIQSIFKSLGTPNSSTWPESSGFPDWGKMAFQDFPAKPWSDLLPRASPSARDLVSNLVCYESSLRLSAEDVRDLSRLLVNTDHCPGTGTSISHQLVSFSARQTWVLPLSCASGHSQLIDRSETLHTTSE